MAITRRRPTVSTDAETAPATRLRPLRVRSETTSRAIRPPVTVQNRRLAKKEFGEAYLTWRCDECGEAGPLTALPETCVACGAGRESLYYAIED